MTAEARKLKNETIKNTLKATREKHSLMRPIVIELKLDLKCLSKKERHALEMYFVEGKWLKNYLLSLSDKDFRSFDTRTRDIHSLDKDKNKVSRHLEMPAKLIQSIYQQIKHDMKALAAKRKKTGRKNGNLKFVSDYTTFDLNQYKNTHWICYGPDGDKNGRYKNTIHIAGIKRPIRAFGMEQIPADAEPANAKLIRKPSGVYVHLACYLPTASPAVSEDEKDDVDRLLEAIGTDLGIKTTITTSDGRKYDISIRETERLKGLQRKLARQIKGSKGWYATRELIQREYEKITNRRKDKANKVFHDIAEGQEVLVIQDDNIRGWQKGLFGKQVQNSCLGTLKSKFKADPRTVVISRWFPSTAVCPICGNKHEGMTLGVKEFVCPVCGYTEERDTKGAITTLLAGEIEYSSTHTERMRTPVELTSDFQRFYEAWKQSALKPEAPSSSGIISQ